MSITACTACTAPLGQDSRDSGYTLCHTHRRCTICEVDLTPVESQYVSENKLEANIRCAQCYALERYAMQVNPSGETPTKKELVTISKAEYDLLNLARRLCTPLPNLSKETNEQDAVIANAQWIANMNTESIILHMRRMQAIAGGCHVALLKAKSDIKQVEREMDLRRGTSVERDLTKHRRAEQAKIDADAEKNLSSTERAARRKRQKGIELLMQWSGLTEKDAATQFDRGVAVQRIMQDKQVSRAEAEKIYDSPDYGKVTPINKVS